MFFAAQPVNTPISINGNFSVGTTGQRTVEFWYKALDATNLHTILSQDGENDFGGGGNGWRIHHDHPGIPGNPDTAFGLRQWYADDGYSQFSFQYATNLREFAWETWDHVAVTLDSEANEAKIYKNGVEIASEFGGSAAGFDQIIFEPKTNSPITLGAQSSGANAGVFLIDELRFSDVVLVPGNGTGVDELAFNTTLPTPSNNGTPGDMNNDNSVDALDIGLTRDSKFNLDGLGDPNIPDEADFDFLVLNIIGTGHGDADLNLIANFNDFVAFSNNFGMNFAGPSLPVPEPAVMTLFGAMAIITLRKPRRVGQVSNLPVCAGATH